MQDTLDYFSIQEYTVPAQYIREYPGATLQDQEQSFLLHVKKYTPNGAKAQSAGAVTLLGAHANGNVNGVGLALVEADHCSP